MFEIGMIHGRFQPFHIGHFDYLKIALKQAKKLIVGITNPDPSSIYKVTSDSHRHLPEANPFSFYLRMKMIRLSILHDQEIQSRFYDIEIVPFPINRPELWKHYIPMYDVVQFVNILDPWDLEKQTLFVKNGFKVVVLEGKIKSMSGTEIRDDLLLGNKNWQEKVPFGTLEILQKLSIENKGKIISSDISD